MIVEDTTNLLAKYPNLLEIQKVLEDLARINPVLIGDIIRLAMVYAIYAECRYNVQSQVKEKWLEEISELMKKATYPGPSWS